MSDLSKRSDEAPASPGLWLAIKKAASRLQDWFVIQTVAVKLTVLVVAVLIPATGIYSYTLIQKQAAVAEQVKSMAVAGKAGEGMWTLNDKLPVVFGTGSLLSFLEANPVERITVVYKPLLWNVSERIILVESQGKQHAYYPSDMETQIFTDKAVTAPWGGKLAFIPRSELSAGSLELFERLDQRFADARPQFEKDGWKAGVSGVLSVALTLGVLGFLYFQLKGQLKSLKFIEPAQVHGSIDDLVGMDDIKAEVAQIKDQYQRRAEYAEYGISKPFNVMFSGPAGTGKTKLASYLAKELGLPILFHSAANLETGFVAGGSNTLSRIVAMARRRKRCIVFLDEAQDLFMKRGGRRKFDDDTANTLLSVLDGVRSRNEAEIIWIVASNFNSETMQMDEAMLRRFQMKVDFRMPNREERLAIIGHYLGQRADKVLPDLDLRHLVDVTEGRSPADLETIVNQAGITAVQAGEMIGADTLMQAAERVLVGNVNTDTTEGTRARPPHHRRARMGPLPGGPRARTPADQRQLGADPGRHEDHQDFAQGQPAHQRIGLRLPQAGVQPAQDQGRHRTRRARAAGRHGQRGTVLRRGRHDQRGAQRHHPRDAAAAPRRGRDGHVPQDPPELRCARQGQPAQPRGGRGNAQHHGSAERAPVRRNQGRAGPAQAADRASGRQAPGSRRDEPE